MNHFWYGVLSEFKKGQGTFTASGVTHLVGEHEETRDLTAFHAFSPRYNWLFRCVKCIKASIRCRTRVIRIQKINKVSNGSCAYIIIITVIVYVGILLMGEVDNSSTNFFLGDKWTLFMQDTLKVLLRLIMVIWSSQ